jgi:hypothetical protein
MAADAPFAGKYSDGNLTVEFSSAALGYTGTLTLGKQQFPATAHAGAHGFDGNFTSGANTFDFTSTLDADTLTLVTGGKTYTLKRVTAAVNPLGDAAAANPLAQAAAPVDKPAAAAPAADAPAGFTVEVATDSGKSLVSQKPGITSVKEALKATFPDLATYFGNRPELGSAYQDAKDPKAGGATFKAVWHDHPVRGVVSCKLHDGGATVAVVFGRADASKVEWEKLLNPPAQTTAAPAAADAPAEPAIPLQNYDFPDGTGSVGLAKGWETKAPTGVHAVPITGPADQFVVLGNTMNISTPDAPIVKMMQQNAASLKQIQDRNAKMGIKPIPMKPAPPMLIAPFTDPAQALKDMIPQFSKMSEFNKGPTLVLDKIVDSKDVPTALKDGKAAVITYDYTRTADGKTGHFRARLHLQICPIGNAAWMWFATSLQAPQATFDRDLPVMAAMAKSLKINQERATEVVNAETRQMQQFSQQMAKQSQDQLEANARQFQQDQATRNSIYQQQHDAQMQGYARHNAQWQADETQKSRNAADFIETIRGTRTVYDTQTGTAGTADLNYVNGVVDSLNNAAMDPNRFVQIPLRDELYPLPGR